MVSNCDVYVPIGHAKVTKTTIATDSLSSCQFFLIDGLYDDTPFGYMYHHDCLIDTGEAESITLKKMLQLLVDTLIAQTSIHFNSTIDFKNFKNLKLFVGGGTVMENDERRNAFYLLINPTEAFLENFSLTLSNDCSLLLDQLVNHTIIIKPVTYPETTDGKLI